MDPQHASWKAALERLWSEPAPDWRAAAQLVAEIARGGGDETLRQAAAQTLPVLRLAALGRTGRPAADAARRRLSTVRDALHVATAPRFGRRGAAGMLTPEQHYRRMLGLPLDRRLAAAEIRQAFKRAAKTLHPDAGGDGKAFLELAAARDALMHGFSKRGD